MSESVHHVKVHGRSIRIAERTGTGRPLVVCNGIGARLELLQPFVDALDPSIPVLRFDVPGVGGSELPAMPYTLPMMAATLGKLLDTVGYQDVDVLGISWGGGLAQQFAMQNPRRCHRLVLVATATGVMMVPARPSVLRTMATQRRHRDPDYAAQVAADTYGGQIRQHPDVARQLFDVDAPGTSQLGYKYQVLAAVTWTSLPFLPFIRQPTLILAGDDDPIIPVANARVMHRLIPHSSLHVYPDGHLALATRAWDLAPRVAAFLRDTADADSGGAGQSARATTG